MDIPYPCISNIMRLSCLLLLLHCLASCELPPKDKKKQPIPQAAQAGTIDYAQCKIAAAGIRRQYSSRWRAIPPEQKSRIFTNTVVEKIIPAWLGTQWNFYGTTEVPGKGRIACGYFVTTVLRDAGLPIARIKLAQCASEEMITALVQPVYIKRYSNLEMRAFIASIHQQGYGLYIIGLDSHTGFLYHDGSGIHFIHASYIGKREVTDEPAEQSVILQQSRYKITGKLSADEKAMNKWIQL